MEKKNYKSSIWPAMVPKGAFLVKGVGRHRYRLKSFEGALREAGVAQQNLVQVSSILPPNCHIVSSRDGLQKLSPGQTCYCVMARTDTNEHGRMITSAIGLAIPKDVTKWGYLSEVHEYGMNHQRASDMAEDLAADMLGTTIGMEVDPKKAWSEKERVYKASGLIIRTSSIVQTAKGQRGLWTTAVAIVVFLFD